MWLKDWPDMTQCMIIEGSREQRALLAGMLSPYGFELEQVADAGKALERCRDVMPDLVVVPEQLAQMDAVSFIKRLRRGGRERAPVVFVCAQETDPEFIGRTILAGATECLVAPYDAEVLDEKLRLAGVV